MDRLIVTYDKLDSFSQQISNCGKQVENTISQIDRIISALPSCCRATNYVAHLNHCKTRIRSLAGNCSKLSGNVKWAKSLFKECEQSMKVISEENMKSAQVEINKWNDGWRKTLDDILDALGIDPYGRNYVDPGEEAQLERDQAMQSAIGDIFTVIATSAAWDRSTQAERQTMIRNVVARINQIQGTNITDVRFFYETPQNGMITNGYYRDSNRSININTYGTDFESVMTTVVHEMRHAYQHQVTRDPDSYIVSESNARSWDNNFDHYINGNTDYNAYRAQPVEQDARDFSEGVDYHANAPNANQIRM